MRSLSSLLVICLVSAIASAADEQERNNFLRHINRRVQEDNSSSTTNDNSDGTTDTATTTTTICEPCPVCDAQQPSSSTISTNSTSSEKIKLRFLVTERDFARLQVMLEQMADDYTRKASFLVWHILFDVVYCLSILLCLIYFSGGLIFECCAPS